jgi:hypothetical protein
MTLAKFYFLMGLVTAALGSDPPADGSRGSCGDMGSCAAPDASLPEELTDEGVVHDDIAVSTDEADENSVLLQRHQCIQAETLLSVLYNRSLASGELGRLLDIDRNPIGSRCSDHATWTTGFLPGLQGVQVLRRWARWHPRPNPFIFIGFGVMSATTPHTSI